MFLSLWHYLKGYVIVEVSGLAIEKFLNLILHQGIIIWDLYRNEERVCFKVKIKDFKGMKQAVKKARCRIKIVRKKGMPFIAHRYKKRKLFVAGVGIFAFLLWLLSSFVWLVEVEGNERVNSFEIIEVLEKQGYCEGKLKSRMNLREAEAYLLAQMPDIIWVGISYEGTRMLVKVAESVPKPNITELNESPKALIAKRDALITYIATQKGKPLVKKGDIVKKGELLVAGEMPLGEENPDNYYAAAEAIVKGKTMYTASSTISLNQVKKKYMNQTSKNVALKLFNYNLKLYGQKPLNTTSDQFVSLHRLKLTRFFPLPFALQIETNIAYQPYHYQISAQEAKDFLLTRLWQQVKQGLSEDAKILKREAFFKQTGDAITGVLYVYAEEDVGYQVELKFGQDIQNKGENTHEQN